MKRNIKAMIGIILTTTLLSNTAIINATSKSDMTVKALATTIDVTVTPTINMEINPNLDKWTEGSIVYNDIVIHNNSKAPVKVVCVGITAKDTGWFELVPKSAYSDWSNLSKEESRKIALGLALDKGWNEIISPTWSTTAPSVNMVGVLNSNKTGVVILSPPHLAHGTSFEEDKSSTFTIEWIIGLE